MLPLEDIRARLASYRPQLLPVSGMKQAAVAIVLRDAGNGLEVLFIERAQQKGDPWSGHMAFPGGRMEPVDPTARAVAERETLEEVGLCLEESDYLGRIDDLQGRPQSKSSDLVISAHVYHHDAPVSLELNYEVADAFWFPLFDLHEDHRHIDFAYEPTPSVESHGPPSFPGIEVGEPNPRVVWGLTYRFLEVFFHALEHPLPDRWKDFTPPSAKA